MGRYTGASCKICRRNREKLMLKGQRCETAKCSMEKRNYPPGYSKMNGKMSKLSEYGIRLREKQKMRFFYGVSERQMRIYFSKATSQKGITGHNLIAMFECRLDNLVYRIKLAKSRKEARQLVKHGYFQVNNRKVDIPSFIGRAGDVISIKKTGKEDFFKDRLQVLQETGIPEWLEYNPDKKEVKIISKPTRTQVDIPVEEQLIVEYYSR